MRATLSATRRLNFEEETPNKDGRNNSLLYRSRTPTPLRVVKMTSEMDRLRLPKRRHDDDDIHVIEEEEYIKKELKEEMIEIDEPDPKRQREDSGIEDDTDDITIVFDNTNKEFPNKRNYSYAGMFEEAGGVGGGTLTGTFMRDFAADQHEPVRRPLGCTYDESSKEWFLADSANDAIRILRKDSTLGTAVYCDLKYPSALVVIEPGRYCAVLDHVGIRLYDYRRESFLNLVEHDLRKGFFNCRGLGLTSAGDLVTIKQSQTRPQILFYSTKKQNDLIKSIPYDIPHNVRGGHEPRPSFLDIAPCGSKDRMVVTDLGLGTFSLYTLNAKSRELKLEQQFDCVGDTDDKFQFISGAKFDANGELFITDARGHNLKYLSKEGTFVQKVKFDDSFSYVSNFCVNSNNELLVCDRRDGRIKLYQLKAKDKLDLYLDTLLEPADR